MKLPEDSHSAPFLSPQIAMADLMAAWPQVIPTLLERRMACVGCDMARFETLADAAMIYGLDVRNLLADLARAIDNPHILEDS
jgi:hybrid cluster-associated redox disulfide protein